MPPSCSPTCCSRSRPWAWACATSPGPKLDCHLRSLADLQRLQGGARARRAHAVPGRCDEAARGSACPPTRALIGFVGGPFTLLPMPRPGSHEGFAKDAVLVPRPLRRLLRAAARPAGRQHGAAVEAGADCVALFDTAAGEMTPASSRHRSSGRLREVHPPFRARCPPTPVIYYSRDTGPDHWQAVARTATSSAWAWTGAMTSPTRWSRRRRTGRSRAISIRSGCTCRPRTGDAACAKCSSA